MAALPLDLRPWLKTLPSPRPRLEDAHSPIGPSSVTRLLKCPASYATSEMLGRAEARLAAPAAAAAERGSREHALVEHALRDNVWPEIVEEFDGYQMGLAAQRHIETIIDVVVQAKQVEALFVEEMLDGRQYHELFFGTTDAGIVWTDQADRPRLSIVDLKTGTYLVTADALQLQLYAALLLLDARTRDFTRTVWHIETTVVQPHVKPMPVDGAVRTARFTRREILASATNYLAAADAATAPDAVEVLPRIPGDHCVFCPAKPVCPARHARREAQAALQLSLVSFDDLEDVEA